jgi:7-cyano-7-deazaguanine reductase
MGFYKKIENQNEDPMSKKTNRKSELKNFKLGKTQTTYENNYNPKLLEAFENKNPQNIAWTTFVCTEFTSLCPKTGQPDFAKVFINYIADKKMIESKSLKMYLFSFRNHGDFHEDCIQTICNDITQLIQPKYCEVIGEFTPRGGIAIFPFASHSNSEKKFKQLSENRLANYSPGKYSCELSKVY